MDDAQNYDLLDFLIDDDQEADRISKEDQAITEAIAEVQARHPEVAAWWRQQGYTTAL